MEIILSSKNDIKFLLISGNNWGKIQKNHIEEWFFESVINSDV